MKKLVLAAAACIMGLSLFLCVQTASAAVAWEALPGYQVVIEFDRTISADQEFGYYTGVFDWDDPDVDDDTFTSITLIDGNIDIDSVWSGYLPDDPWKFYFYDGNLDSDPFYLTYDYREGGFPGHYELTVAGMTVTVLNAVPTPVPTAALLLGSGLVGLVGFRRRFGK